MDDDHGQASDFPDLFGDLDPESSLLYAFNQSDVHCILCRRSFSVQALTNEGLEAILICRDCKLTVFDDIDNISHNSTQRRHQRARSQSSESVEDLFSQRLQEILGPLLQNREAQQRAGYNGYRNRSRRWRHTLSDNGSDGFDQGDSLFGESDSNISITGFGGESDASLDGLSLGRDMFDQQDAESHADSDTDIDPMHAGLDQWNSNDQDDEAVWEEAVMLEQDRQMHSGDRSAGSSGRLGGWLLWRSHYPFAGLAESDAPHYVGNPGDYLDARGFEELLNQLAETDVSRRGAPPASAAFIESLPQIVINESEENDESLVCAVCKDHMPVGTIVNQLPCRHMYHPSCIQPWLSTRNSCPVCRYELPTDDPDYEEGKVSMDQGMNYRVIHQHDIIGDGSSTTASDSETDESEVGDSETLDLGRDTQEDASVQRGEVENGQNTQRSRRGWFYLAAAPIVGIVGFVLVMWLHNSQANMRTDQLLRPRSLAGQEDRMQVVGRRRWWSFF